jgi:hypothetical protein
MPLYEVTDTGLEQRPPAGFAALEMYERQDLQRLLREQISALGEDLLVIAEEFGQLGGRWTSHRPSGPGQRRAPRCYRDQANG